MRTDRISTWLHSISMRVESPSTSARTRRPTSGNDSINNGDTNSTNKHSNNNSNNDSDNNSNHNDSNTTTTTTTTTTSNHINNNDNDNDNSNNEGLPLARRPPALPGLLPESGGISPR